MVCLSKISIDNTVLVYCELALSYLFGTFCDSGCLLRLGSLAVAFSIRFWNSPRTNPSGSFWALSRRRCLANVRCASEPTRHHLRILQNFARRANHFVFSEMACPAPFAKIFPFAPDPNQFNVSHRPVPKEGRCATSSTRGGMRWTWAAHLTNGAAAYGEVVSF